MTLKSLAPFVFLLFILPSCTTEEPEVDPSEAGAMSCTLNGESWSAISFRNTLYKFTTDPKGKRLDIVARGMGIEMTVGFSLYTDDLDNSMPLVTYKTNSEVYGAIVVITDGALVVPTILGGGGYGEVTLTSIDPSEKKISGTFEFDLNPYPEGEDDYVAVDGVFTDLIFTLE